MKTFDLRDTMQKKEKDESKKNIIFMGTGPFAMTILKAIMEEDDVYNVIAVVTKPDARTGRGGSDQSIQINAIKELAFGNGIELLQPKKFDDETLDEINALAPDLIVVASYGKILPKELLSLSEFGAINVHASLLPLLRGASPIQNAIIQDFDETGITIMKMDAGMDTGDIIIQKRTPIGADMLAQELEHILAQQGAALLRDVLPKWFNKEITAKPQDHAKATLCQMIERADGHVVWIHETARIYNLYRALSPWPGIFAYWKRSPTERIRIKLIKIRPYEGATDLSRYTTGTVFETESMLCVRTLDGAVVIDTLQRADKKAMNASDFLAGNQKIIGTVLQ